MRKIAITVREAWRNMDGVQPEVGFDAAYSEPARRVGGGLRQVRKHAVVTGMVQGVGFRYESVRAARRIGIVGWVRNCMDGSVELEFQGEPGSVAQMIEWLWHGPQWARVDDVTVESEPPKDVAHAERAFTVVR